MWQFFLIQLFYRNEDEGFKYLFVIFLLFAGKALQAQSQQLVDQHNLWLNYVGNHRLSKQFSLHTFYSLRRNDFIAQPQQSLLRLGLNYHLPNSHLIFATGYDWLLTYPYGKQPIARSSHEHRIYQRLMLKSQYNRFVFKHRFLFEQRFLTTASIFRLRTRYRFDIICPITDSTLSDKTWFVAFFNELFINHGRHTNNHIFNQNWAYLGIGYKYNKYFNVGLGYMNQYLSKSNGYQIEQNHTVSLTVGCRFR